MTFPIGKTYTKFPAKLNTVDEIKNFDISQTVQIQKAFLMLLACGADTYYQLRFTKMSY